MRETAASIRRYGGAMDTEHLVAFQRVVREGSFTRAALSLGVAQSAISARVRAIEAAVGGALFTRGRRIALTPLGESFLPFARRATEVLAAGIEAAKLTQTGERGRVTLAALGSLTGGLVGPAMAAMTAKQPSLDWVVRSGDHESVLGLLWDGVVELGVVAWPCPETSAAELTRVFLMREPVVLAASPRHPLASRRQVTRADIVRLARPFLRLRWWRTHHPEIEKLVARAGVSVEAPMEAARHLCARGAAAGFFPETYIADDLAAGRLIAIPVRDLAPLSRATALVRKARSTPPSPATLAMIEALRAQASSIGILEASRSHRAPRR
jgi:DNA-binding transcriptional LysR family regulator